MAGGYRENTNYWSGTYIKTSTGITEIQKGVLSITFGYDQKGWEGWKPYIEEAQVCWNYWYSYKEGGPYNPELSNGIQSIDVDQFTGPYFNSQFDLPNGVVWVRVWARLKWKSYEEKVGNDTVTKYYGGTSLEEGAEDTWFVGGDWRADNDSWPKLPPEPQYSIDTSAGYKRLKVTFSDLRPVSPDGLCFTNDLRIQLWTHDKVEEEQFISVWNGNTRYFDADGDLNDDGYNFRTSAVAYFDMVPGNEYYLRATSVRYGDGKIPINRASDKQWYPLGRAGEISWTNWVPDGENGIVSEPIGVNITKCVAISATAVSLSWTAAKTASYYKIIYATERSFLEDSNMASSVTTEEALPPTTTSFIVGGLETGKEYWFGVRGVNDGGEGLSKNKISIVLGKRPNAPTTWSSTTTATLGKKVMLYWAHNSEDNSIQENAQVSIEINGKATIIDYETPKSEEGIVDDDNREPTDFHELDTSEYKDGATIKWKVRTAGILRESDDSPAYGPWSIVRTIEVFAPPRLIMYPRQMPDNEWTITEFPYDIFMVAGPENQDVLSFHLSIISASKYTDFDPTGTQIYVGKGQEIFSLDYDPPKTSNFENGLIDWDAQYKRLVVTLNPQDVNFANGMTYTVNGSVTMNTGLTAYSSYKTTVNWNETMDGSINGSVYIHKEDLTAQVTASYRNSDGELDRDVYLNYYRRTFDGKYLALQTNVENIGLANIIDPHPPLDYADYRITAIKKSTGSVMYADLAPAFVGEIFAVIQWDEAWPDYYEAYTGDGMVVQPKWEGTMLKLPWNLDISDKWSPQSSSVEYIGREHPVGYYGTQEGHTASWKIDVVKADREMVAKLRRLATYKGNVYVREPYGSGYWAMVRVSFSQNHTNLVVPVTLDITRVEGGV